MKTGDIVLIPFPFSELTQVKLRPAIVITVTKDKLKTLCFVLFPHKYLQYFLLLKSLLIPTLRMG